MEPPLKNSGLWACLYSIEKNHTSLQTEIKCSDLRQVGGFLLALQFPPPLKLTTMIDITEILLKVALNNITPTLTLK